MRGVILAAGGGTRLRPLTDDLPKTMLAVQDERSILELAVANLASCGLTDIVVVTGHAAQVVEDQVGSYEARYGVSLSLRYNDRYADLNNAYSLWLVRDLFDAGALLVNGDTVHPSQVQRALLAAEEAPVVLALDRVKHLGDEEMKVLLREDGTLQRISKSLDPSSAAGEYIGVARLGPSGASLLSDSLRATFERDPQAYYEDGFQEFSDRGGKVVTVSIPEVGWVEVDDHDDLARAREVTASWS